MSEQAQFKALLPMLVFLLLFIGTGIGLTLCGAEMPFYQLSATVAIIPAIVLALAQGKEGLNRKIAVFLSGAGEINIITMCMIFLLAGGFASVASAIGGVKATVNFGLSLLPPSMILPGLFLIGAFISTAMGTSMGTVAAIAPIAVGVGEQTDIPLTLLLGVVMGGAMFGDNLSMISDTTIAATRTQGCEMKDKFRMNLLIALPAALLTLAFLWYAGSSGQTVRHEDYALIRVAPYLAVLVLALAGVNVFVVLLAGIVFTGAVGMASVEGYTALRWCKDIYGGFAGMNEIMVLSMLVGGLGELMRHHGGIAWLLKRVNGLAARLSARSPVKAGECCISLLVLLANLCTANNTVAIILTGKVAHEITSANGVDRRRSASLLDIFSCVVQGLIPYGAQLLLAGSIARLSPLSIAGNNWYCMALAATAALAVLFGVPRLRAPLPLAGGAADAGPAELTGPAFSSGADRRA
ncbi:MAG TPA: Na+/H+ antiporter NhaC family protein [Candidatus Bilophila faecipullorum]|uniref:Na+/H+ antiporter NhaC family protein n=1 Tax=Candidatus Bilophila faecipullorum TaxID=2838482 RepID=A0A9D1U8D0_9BACT|nr:Na+/H+ antiporter NhaC family protein [uncultured Bilophila sp.]HIW77983.1 Na+/H+ antiporter NhaC family protein [Candidatus Bilophila faecipullorum]